MNRLIKQSAIFSLLLSLYLFNLPAPVFAQGLIGSIKNPTPINSTQGSGLFQLLGNIFSLTLTIAGIVSVFQFITAGYMYITANGDSKKTETAWNKIWQSILGLVIIASAFVIARVIGNFIGVDPTKPKIYGP